MKVHIFSYFHELFRIFVLGTEFSYEYEIFVLVGISGMCINKFFENTMIGLRVWQLFLATFAIFFGNFLQGQIMLAYGVKDNIKHMIKLTVLLLANGKYCWLATWRTWA